jgi:hypothetical protein
MVELLFSSKGGQSVQKGAKAPPFLWEKGAPANFKIPKILTEFSFGIGMVNTKKIPKGSYRNTESEYNSRKKVLFTNNVLIPFLHTCYLMIAGYGFFGGALTGPYPMLRFGGACGLGVGAW